MKGKKVIHEGRGGGGARGNGGTILFLLGNNYGIYLDIQ